MQQSQSLKTLIGLAQARDHDVCRQLYDQFKNVAFQYAFSLLGDLDLAQDALQDAFLNAYCDLASLNNPDAFPGWLKTIVRRRAAAIRRGRKILAVPLDDNIPAPEGRDALNRRIEREHIKQHVRSAVKQLPETERVLVEMFYLDELPLKEIQQRTGVPIKTIRSRLHTARERLRNRIMNHVKQTVRDDCRKGARTVFKKASRQALKAFDRELNKLRMPDEEEQNRACELCCAKARMLRYLGRAEEALEALQVGLRYPVISQRVELHSRLLTEIGITQCFMNDYQPAEKSLRQALKALREKSSQEHLIAAIENGLGISAWGRGDVNEARKHFEGMLSAAREAREKEFEAEALNNIAIMDMKAGRLKEALAGLRKTIKRWRKLDQPFGEAIATLNLGILEEQTGRLNPAEGSYHAAARLGREIGFETIETAALGNLSNLALIREKYTQALECARQSREVAERIRDRRSQAIALENEALAHCGLKQYADAERALAVARRLARNIDDQARLRSLELLEIELHIRQNQIDNLDRSFSRLEDELQRSGHQSEMPRLLRLKSEWLIAAGDRTQAAKAVRQGLAECNKQNNRVEDKPLRAMAKHLNVDVPPQRKRKKNQE